MKETDARAYNEDEEAQAQRRVRIKFQLAFETLVVGRTASNDAGFSINMYINYS